MQRVVRPQRGARFIGLSNFGPKHVEEIMALPGIKPQYHELELHPHLQQNDWVKENQKYNITLIGYAPLANTQDKESMGVSVDRTAVPPMLSNEIVQSIAKERGCTPAQVVLAWNLHRDVVVIPKAIREAHQKENIKTLEQCSKFSDEDAKKMEKIGPAIRFYPNACTYLTEGCEMAKAHPSKTSPKRLR